MNGSRFSFDIASIVFGDEVSPERVRCESRAVERFRSWIDASTQSAVEDKAVSIDAMLIPMLSGPNMLEVARMIEARCPKALELMPKLKAHLAHLHKAHQLSQVFMPVNMSMLIQALEEEGGR